MRGKQGVSRVKVAMEQRWQWNKGGNGAKVAMSQRWSRVGKGYLVVQGRKTGPSGPRYPYGKLVGQRYLKYT